MHSSVERSHRRPLIIVYYYIILPFVDQQLRKCNVSVRPRNFVRESYRMSRSVGSEWLDSGSYHSRRQPKEQSYTDNCEPLFHPGQSHSDFIAAQMSAYEEELYISHLFSILIGGPERVK